MALNTPRALSRQALRNCSSRLSCPAARTAPLARQFGTSSALCQEGEQNLPRWAHTPERMKAPFSPHITRDPSRSIWKVNTDPKKLDEALNSFLGRDGERLLPDELKWLAVTHKSFDQGRRGFNDRLAFLGRQIQILETTQHIITSPDSFEQPENDPFANRREPFVDTGLRNLDNLSTTQPNEVFTLEALNQLAKNTGLADVVRWKPRLPENLDRSGVAPVMAGAIYAIIGAISLQHGGKIASRIFRERVMKRVKPSSS